MSEKPFRVQALGSLRAWLGDDELELGPARQRAVFAALATRAVTRPITRAELIQAVWGDTAPVSANGSVHTYISGLRRILEPSRTRWSTDGLLVSDSAGYRLRLDSAALDIGEFGRLRETARAHWQENDAAGTVETLDRALALWSGEALTGIPGPHAESLRAGLAEQRLAALELRAAGLLALGAHEDLVSELTLLVREHPLREPLWQSLMIALHRGGRTTEALDAFRTARRILRAELGVQPGRKLVEIHQRILVNDPELAPPVEQAAAVETLSVLPGPVAHALEARGETSPVCHGREGEVTLLRRLAEEVLAGRGRTVWIEGEPGIGKSEVLTRALADVGERGCHVAWAAASELEQLFPLQVVLECLGLDAKLIGADATANGTDPVAAAADQILTHIDRLCATAPLVMVIDDLQWADEASVLMWNRLSAATRQLPLLLIAASRPVPRREELVQARQAAEARGLELITLGPLTVPAAEDLLGDLIGARPGEELCSLITKAAGNPLYLREVTGALMREDALKVVDGIARVRTGTDLKAPESLLDAVSRTLDLLGEFSRETVRRAAVLGMEFGLAQVGATMGKMPSELLGVFEEVMEMRIIVDTGTQLAFRHPMLRWALYNEIPGDVRAEWHRRAAEALAEIGSGVEHVAQQLVAVPAAVDDWVIGWLADHHESLANRAPSIAAVLLHRVLDECPADDPRREALLAAYVLVLFRLDQEPFDLAREAMLISRDPNRAAEMRHLAAAMAHRRGDTDTAISLLARNDSPETPPIWRERRRALLANFDRGTLDDLEEASRKALRSYRQALSVGEPYPIGHALQTLWLVKSIERDHEGALRHVEQAIEAVEGHQEHAGFYFDLLDNRLFTLQNLDQLDEARSTLRTARRAAAKYSLPHGLQVSSAVHDYWTGEWDDALAELDTVTEDGPAITFHGHREPGAAALLLHGVAGLIHGRRGETEQAAAHLYAAEEHIPVTGSERESCDFLLVARSLQAEQRGDPDQAVALLSPVMDPTYAAMMLRHQWLPWLIRLAKAQGGDDIAAKALDVCREEAAKEVTPARATAAARWCEALVSGEPGPLLEAVDHYDKVGRRIELASALGDAAVLLAGKGRLDEARAAANDAVAELDRFGAQWDVEALEQRLRKYSITLGRPDKAVAAAGWASLSAMERAVATLAGQGRSNPEIATALALPRRTVQAHVTRVLAVLGLESRNGLAGLPVGTSIRQVARSSR
ncbi:BTAD domain-containing putative transcriptional regulator [Amycolatopsis regifaucium]|uniref:SARP family transcriptional regulator n=1 Tax=Amycolatopsis regifaucium TaxID=546365 RepID=A0A154MVP1_9PSEU|nr:BTAD domain-containing putative transcriptional regulator [Amycolatopsis regifaucium]KZB88013.1 SARP family transcriptional regulator [Amycolatopsis regifaucium]OKA04484.1 SARP family transcriptional regulator [Amycolatopsis regifaucium]SFH50141.1 Transcriptional regulatory protein, C terminal [Amycolatopsis regifaucium]